MTPPSQASSSVKTISTGELDGSTTSGGSWASLPPQGLVDEGVFPSETPLDIPHDLVCLWVFLSDRCNTDGDADFAILLGTGIDFHIFTDKINHKQIIPGI